MCMKNCKKKVLKKLNLPGVDIKMAGWNAQASSFPELNLVFYLELNLASFNLSLNKKKTFVKELQVISLRAKYRRNR